jgi:hypothetical protein
MRFYSIILAMILCFAGAACSTAEKRPQPETPLDALKTYGNAFKKKDLTTVKLLLSQETIRMHEQEAKAQNVTVDDIVRRDTLFSETQTTAEFRNQKIEDGTATIEMKDSTGLWNTVQFIREDGAWKIDRRGFANKIEQEVRQDEQKFNEIFNSNRQ